MGKLKYLMIHCTATENGKDLTSDDIRRMHMGPCKQPNGSWYWGGKIYAKRESLPDIMFHGKRLRDCTGRGWNQVGYSDMIHLDGRIENLVSYDADDIIQPREITNGAVGMNGETRHIVYVGGVDHNNKPEDTRTENQKFALRNYAYDHIELYPVIQILGHNQVAAKACPSFDVPKWCDSMGIYKANIYIGKQN
jgi:N-acetylmuramoyl-L-alanine amidase